MSYFKKFSWNGNESVLMAAHMILELNGVNNLDVKNWLEYDEVNWIEKAGKPHKKTLLHDYISYIYHTQNQYLLGKDMPMAVINPLIEMMDIYEEDYSHIGEVNFINLTDDEIHTNGYDIRAVVNYGYKLFNFFNEQLEEKVVDDIFTVLFTNKQFLFDFNMQLKDLIVALSVEDNSDYLKKNGVFNRPGYIPVWLKRGINLRDKVRCQICGADLTQVFTRAKLENYDHIIPLAQGGTNDPTNFQLTCESCNKSKGARSTSYSSLRDRFWDLDN